jgi:predicted SAM-dependent methyltransferase
MPTLKQRLGAWLIPRLPVNAILFRQIRLELNAAWVRLLGAVHPAWRRRRHELLKGKGLLVNIGCGPFGKPGWVNLDLFSHEGTTMRVDSRRPFPFGSASCRGIHVEHYLEHLEPSRERAAFLAECWRCLEPGGILRIIVPDARKYAAAYLADGWQELNTIGCGGDLPEGAFATKMEALNHVFLQDGEHYGGIDAEFLGQALRRAGFSQITLENWRTGGFPEGCIDREQHRPYSLYMEARK